MSGRRSRRLLTGALGAIAATGFVAGLVAVPAAPAAAGEPAVLVRGGGWGHGVGMSQYGAHGMAKAGFNATQILQHYYSGVGVVGGVGSGDVRVLLSQSTESVRITPRTGPTLLDLPNGGTVEVPQGWTVVIGTGGSGGANLIVKLGAPGDGNPPQVAGSPFSGSAQNPQRAKVRLRGVRATVAQPGFATRDYRWGDVEVSGLVMRGQARGCSSMCTVIRNMSLEQYLYGLGEMPSSWEIDALKAQAVAGRTYASRKLGTDPNRLFDLYATVLDQAYVGWSKEGEVVGGTDYGARWVRAVDETAGFVARYGGAPISTLYSSSSGGHTENSEYVFVAAEPYLRGKPDPRDSVSPRHSWSRTYTLRQIGQWFGVANVRDVQVTGPRGVSGRVDKAQVRIVGDTTRVVDGSDFRATVNAQNPDELDLWSTKFVITSTSGFPDVPPASYYNDGVTWLVQEGITTGVGSTGLYKPGESVSRAQMAAFLWRMMGQPGGNPAHGFPDVPGDSYYEQAVRYLAARGVTGGVGNTGLYKPHEAVTRAQMVTFLHRLAGSPAPPGGHPFPDVAGNSYYATAVAWAYRHGVTTGVGDTGLFKPHDVVTRGQMAAFLHRLATTPGAWATTLPPTAP